MKNDQQKMLDELLEVESGLTGWEMDFIEDLDGRRDRPLTENQKDKLEQIWDNVVGSGKVRGSR